MTRYGGIQREWKCDQCEKTSKRVDCLVGESQSPTRAGWYLIKGPSVRGGDVINAGTKRETRFYGAAALCSLECVRNWAEKPSLGGSLEFTVPEQDGAQARHAVAIGFEVLGRKLRDDILGSPEGLDYDGHEVGILPSKLGEVLGKLVVIKVKIELKES